MERRYGLLLPHFGRHASPDALVGIAPTIERYGFDSVWVRDHLIFHPHGFEDPDRTHVEPFIVLSAVGTVTSRLQLGFGSLIPYRHPIDTALSLASLDWMTGGGRVIAGFGLGTFQHEFDAVGVGGADRRELLPEQIEIMRRLWTGAEIDHEGAHYTFTGVDIHPTPPNGDIPVWYCGTSLASIRRTIEWALQGWMPGRINFATFEKLVGRLRQKLAERATQQMPTVAAIPITSPGRSYEEAVAKVGVEGMLASARNRGWVPGESGRFAEARDLAGALLAGTADDIVADVERYHDLGLTHLVFDLRARFDEWQEQVGFLAEQVLPKLREG